MTDRIHSLTVVLDHDIRSDDIETLINAIRLLRGVLTVETHVADIVTLMAEERARHEMRTKINAVLYPKE